MRLEELEPNRGNEKRTTESNGYIGIGISIIIGGGASGSNSPQPTSTSSSTQQQGAGSGSIVVEVISGSPAQQYGVTTGCVVIGVNFEKFISHAHTVATLRHGKRPLTVRFRR